MMPINTLMTQEASNLFYDPAFRRMLETHIPMLRIHGSTDVIDLPPLATYRYRGDLYGYLRIQGVPKDLHWLTMRMSGMDAPTQFDETITQLLIPAGQYIEQIRNAYRTVEKKMA